LVCRSANFVNKFDGGAALLLFDLITTAGFQVDAASMTTDRAGYQIVQATYSAVGTIHTITCPRRLLLKSMLGIMPANLHNAGLRLRN
jgi:hypothetical protein